MIGKPDYKIIEAVIETLPLEISILDHRDKVLAWNKHETRVFKRPPGALGRDVRNCHPKKSVDKVEQILDEMKKNKRDKARFWVDIPFKDGKKHKILIEYLAIRDKNGEYLGCLEATRDITDIQNIKGEKRLLD